MKSNKPAGSFRLFLKSFLISLAVIVPLFLICFRLYGPTGEGEQPVTAGLSELPVVTASRSMLLAVADGDRLLFGAALRMDTEHNCVTLAILPASAFPPSDSSPILRGGGPSSFMDSAYDDLCRSSGIAMEGYACLSLETLEKLIDRLGSFHFNVTQPIRAVTAGGLAEFRLERGYQRITGGTAAAILRYARYLPEEQYLDIAGRLSESALVALLTPAFPDAAFNAFCALTHEMAISLSSVSLRTLHRSLAAVCQNGGTVRLMQPGETLAQLFS